MCGRKTALSSVRYLCCTKQDKEQQLKPLADFFLSQEMGEILAHNGRFPSVSPYVDNQLSAAQQFLWLGWDFIYNNDIPSLIRKCEKIFHENSKLNTTEV
ncbi:MAG: ABC transporter substrate-binding protein [Bacteroidales bacterium]|nr:ABC transporter substrate-binding protein [Bacteroidales bacterium]